ncbi:MAG: HAD family hydrolase [Clostridia bacterium]|nr:HAD family hydrolase [Clostridia bacterium]
MGKAVFFDLDGTVLDTLEDISDCMNVALKDLGYAPRTYAEFRPVVGNDAPNFMRKLLGDLPLNTLMAIWDYYIPIVEKYGTQKSKVFSGVKDVLYSLKEKGYKLILYTNKTADELKPFVDKFLFDLDFDDIVAVGGTEYAKPNPEKVLEILQKYSVEKENAFMVGDGETDMLTATNSNITAIGVLWGNRDKDQLINSGAKFIVDTPIELLNIIR